MKQSIVDATPKLKAFHDLMKAMWNDEGPFLEMDYFNDMFGFKNDTEDEIYRLF